jgi:hypothetical protein
MIPGLTVDMWLCDMGKWRKTRGVCGRGKRRGKLERLKGGKRGKADRGERGKWKGIPNALPC